MDRILKIVAAHGRLCALRRGIDAQALNEVWLYHYGRWEQVLLPDEIDTHPCDIACAASSPDENGICAFTLWVLTVGGALWERDDYARWRSV